MATGYKVLLRLDQHPAFDWPPGASAPLVGDKISGMFNGSLYEAAVISRHWNFDPADAETAVLVVTAETPQPRKSGSASVQPIRM